MEVPKLAHLKLAMEEEGHPRTYSEPIRSSEPWILPEITVEDFTDMGADSPSSDDPFDSGMIFGKQPTSRPRANTCPEDLFRKKNERPPTPPPGTFRKGHKFKKPAMKESVSFTHHKLSKLTETEDTEEEQQILPEAAAAAAPKEKNSVSAPRQQSRLTAKRNLLCSQGGKPVGYQWPGSGRGRFTATKNVVGKSNSDSTSTNSGDNFLPPSPAHCRFAQKSPGLDNKQLQAC